MNRIFTSLLFFSTIVLHVAVASTHSLASQSAAPCIHVAAVDSLISDTAAVDTLAADSLLDETLDTTPLPQRLNELLNNDIFQRTQVGLYVYDLTADTLVFAYHEKQCMRPASNEKLVTAITALHTLGTDYHYRTTLYADTAVVDSTLQGNLYIRAGYDPSSTPKTSAPSLTRSRPAAYTASRANCAPISPLRTINGSAGVVLGR